MIPSCYYSFIHKYLLSATSAKLRVYNCEQDKPRSLELTLYYIISKQTTEIL